MEEAYHIPAMLKETIEGLAIKPNGVYVDVTFGGGGHSRAILEALSHQPSDISRQPSDISRQPSEFSKQPSMVDENKGHLYSFDQDIDAFANAKQLRVESLELKEVGESKEESSAFIDNPRWTFVHSNFRYLKNWMDYYGVEAIDGLLADLGVSFHHFDCPERGFSFRYSAPLDMRMNQTAKRTAADIVNWYSEEELSRVFWLYGELKNGRQIARNICQARSRQPILRTEDLIVAALKLREVEREKSKVESQKSKVESQKSKEKSEELEIPANAKKDLAKLFQALRIEVNDELGALREMLVAARDLLKPGGRIAILTYHSLEDRLVKNFFRSGNLEGEIEKDFYGNNMSPFEVIEKGCEASAEEVERNPRARSAKLRVAEKK